jgi:serine protease AprX
VLFSGNRSNGEGRVRDAIGNTLWGGKDGKVRTRVLVAAAVAILALVAPAIAKAGAVPPELLAQAQANPSQTFDVIVQSVSGKGGGGNAAQATVNGITNAQRRAFNESFRTASDLQKKALDLAKRAGDAATKASDAQAKAAAAAAKAAQTGKKPDLDAAAKAQAAAQQALADAQAAQDAASAAQATAVSAQMALVQMQAVLLVSQGQASQEIRWQYSVIPAVAANLTGSDIVNLQSSPDVLAVTPDTPVASTAGTPEKWADAMGARQFWGSGQRRQAGGVTPTIAIVDSGIDASRIQDFGARVLGQVNLTTLQPNSAGDGRGHGTMVASVAAGASDTVTGVDPDAPLISLDVINDNGDGLTSDVLAATDWILQNKNRYNIRVANFSLESATNSSFLFDPLAKAVEQLWFNGVVVVAAAGNEATGGAQSGVYHMPAADPFVLTVGAVDIGRDGRTDDDVAAPWSSWGYTNDGFLKPEIAAPGRYIVAACPVTGTLCQTGGQDPTLAPSGYIQLSGTSFAAPMVSAAAAALLGLHPDWTPDQVKGQLMLAATALPAAVPGSTGVGELNLRDALAGNQAPPNPNLALENFVQQTPAGPAFDVDSWVSEARRVGASWSSASWASASWASASWASASWASASWNSASWASAAWSSASWASASWASAAAGLTIANNASADTADQG